MKINLTLMSMNNEILNRVVIACHHKVFPDIIAFVFFLLIFPTIAQYFIHLPLRMMMRPAQES